MLSYEELELIEIKIKSLMITKLNRVTSKGTVAFRGEKRATLLTFGSMFNLEEYKDDIWKLIPITESNDPNDFSEENSDAEALNDNAIEQEIEEITSSVNDDLPF
jgi:hypothetical protein